MVSRKQRGVTTLEYLVLAAVLVLGVVAALTLFADDVEQSAGNVGGGVEEVARGSATAVGARYADEARGSAAGPSGGAPPAGQAQQALEPENQVAGDDGPAHGQRHEDGQPGMWFEGYVANPLDPGNPFSFNELGFGLYNSDHIDVLTGRAQTLGTQVIGAEGSVLHAETDSLGWFNARGDLVSGRAGFLHDDGETYLGLEGGLAGGQITLGPLDRDNDLDQRVHVGAGFKGQGGGISILHDDKDEDGLREWGYNIAVPVIPVSFGMETEDPLGTAIGLHSAFPGMPFMPSFLPSPVDLATGGVNLTEKVTGWLGL